ncbi:MAG: metallophosphoesterase family protein [Planctomycetes bacterium]|nr:metallophosphoesterase family protein [Planctomycetota bacterium]
MRIGILSDTHNDVDRTRVAVNLLQAEGAQLLVHCGDLATPEVVAECAVLPFYFVFGNHDSDMAPILQAAADAHGATCLGWGGEFSASQKRIAVVHGFQTSGNLIRHLLLARNYSTASLTYFKAPAAYSRAFRPESNAINRRTWYSLWEGAIKGARAWPPVPGQSIRNSTVTDFPGAIRVSCVFSRFSPLR